MDPELTSRLDRLEQKIDAAYEAAHKTERYLFWAFVASIVAFVLPLIGLLLAVPAFLSSYNSTINSLVQ